MKAFALFGRPEFLRSFHGWATILWFLVSFPLAWKFGSSVVFVTFLSLYAIVTGHWSSWQAARVEVKQDVEIDQVIEERINGDSNGDDDNSVN